MGFFDKLQKFNETLDKISSTKENVKKGINKKERTDDEKADIRKANIWTAINLLLAAGLAVAVYFMGSIVKSDFSSLLWILPAFLVLFIGIGFSVGKERTFVRDDVVGYGAKLFYYFTFAAAIAAVVVPVFLLIIL